MLQELRTIKRVLQYPLKLPAFVLKDSFHILYGKFVLSKWVAIQRFNGRKISYRINQIGERKLHNIRISEYSQIDQDCTFWLGKCDDVVGQIHIGKCSYIGRNCYLGSDRLVKIGSDCLIGAYTYLTTANHEFKNRNVPIRKQGVYGADLTIGNGAWIGAHVVLLPGTEIGDGAIVGAGAVVNRPIPACEIWAGVPAKKIGER